MRSNWVKQIKVEYQNNNNDCRIAIIKSVDGEFTRCDYSGLSEPYTFEDWMFLLMVAEKIKDLFGEKYKDIQGMGEKYEN